MRRAIREYGRYVAAIVIFAVISAVCGAYIMTKQRLRTPLMDRYAVKVELPTSQSLTPGLGQPVNVAGVRVGDVVDTTLVEGRSVVELSIDPGKLSRVNADARAELRPNTPLKDMMIELFPGQRRAGKLSEGSAVPVARSSVPVDADDLTSALDADTRAYFQALVVAAEGGLKDRGRDLRAAFRALGPTTEQARQLGDALAGRRRELARLVHNLSILSAATATKDRELAQVVEAGDTTLRAIANQDTALREAIAQLPGTLSEARSTLRNATGFADELRPTLQSLMPTARRLPGALRAAKPLLDEAEPLVRTQIRPLVREAAPVVRDLTPAIRDLRVLSPHFISVFKTFDYIANELGYNPPGPDEGYLFWLAWFAHNANSALSTEDAHGSAVRGLAIFSCSTLTSQPQLGALLTALSGQTPVCP
jgi:phospholipid/cholesterol/gamma-HCH transport system substrate-binding protein